MTLVVLGCTAAPRLQAAPSCDALYNAAIKTFQTPHHAFSTTTPRGGKPRFGETVFVGGIEYLKLNDKWQRSPLTPQAMVESAREKLRTHPDTCTLLGDQTADGQSVTVYQVHSNDTGTD